VGGSTSSEDLYVHGALHVLGVLDPAPEPVFDDLTQLALEVAEADGVEITFADGRRQVRKSAAGRVPSGGSTGPVGARIGLTVRSGLPVGELVVYGADITGSRREMLDRIARQAAAVLDERLSANWHEGGASIGVTVVGRDGLLLSASPDLEQLFGWSLEEARGLQVIDLVHPEDIDAALVMFERSGEVPGLKSPFDVRLRAKDGKWISVELTGDNRLDDPMVQGVVYAVREQRTRPHGEHMLAREAAILQRIASGERLATVAGAVAAVLDDLIEGGAGCVLLVEDLARELVDPVGGRARPSGDDVTADGSERTRPPTLVPVGAWALPQAVVRAIEGIPVGPAAPPPGRCAYQGQIALSVELSGDPTWDPWSEVLEAHGIESCWAVPVFDSHRDRMLGAVAVFRTSRGRPTFGESQIMDVCAGLTTSAIQRQQSEAELVARASRDPLTGLPNRSQFLALLDEMLRVGSRGSGPSVIFLDIDRFKVINDSLGHAAGDVLLREVAVRLADALSPTEMVARFGGDEFTCIVPESTADEALGRAKALLSVFDEPLEVGGREIFINASVGVVCADSGAPDAGTLLQHADAALFRAKELGRGQAALFDDELQARAEDRLAVEHGLRAALREHELVVHFQPQFTMGGDVAVGAEALVRWRHPQWGMTAPDRFIHVAEETGVIGPVTEVVLSESCRLARAITGAPGSPEIPIWINLSPSQLRHPGLVGWIDRVLRENGVEGRSIGIEITEGALMDDPDTCIGNLLGLRKLGIHLGIDDFGTGYSSLSYLRSLPVDLLKLDHSFIANLGEDPQHDAIVATVFDLARTLGMASLAEGVETRAQRDHLERLGCERVQGFLFSRPGPAEEILDVLLAGSAPEGSGAPAARLA
jgi:diguanylate cyclase (GGDEF)-like protein/PAS domain S-box-containing protein